MKPIVVPKNRSYTETIDAMEKITFSLIVTKVMPK